MGALKQIAFRIFGTLFLTLVLIWGGGFFRVSFGQVAPSTAQVMSVSLYMLDAENNEVPNGEYEVRFALYTNDRLESDGYPSNADANTRVWEETQTVSVYNGIVSAFLGSVVPFPENLTFDEGEYYLGIRINQDAEIAPRKKLGSVPTAINSQFLRGKTIGTDEGDLVVLEKGGKLNQDFIPEITALGTVSQGVWEGEVIESDYIVKALTDKTYNGLILAKSGSGFSIEGGSSVLEVQADVALNQNLLTSSAPQFVGIGLSSAAAPIAPDAGDIYSDGSDLYFYNGTTWEDLTLASAGGNVSGSGVAGQLTYWASDIDLASASLLGAQGITISTTPNVFEVGIDLVTLAESATTTNESSRSGLELTADGLRMLGGCEDGQVLAWDDVQSVWTCSNKTAGNSDWTTSGGIITFLTDTNDDFAVGTVSGSPAADTAVFGVDRTNGIFYFSSDNVFSPNPTLRFTSNGGATDTISFTDQGNFVISGGDVVIGGATASARLSLAGGDNSIAPLAIGASSSFLEGIPGTVQSDGDHLYFTTSSGTREFLALGSDVTGAAHNRLELISGSYGYLSLNETAQQLTLNSIDVGIGGDVTGVLPVVNGGTGQNDIPGSGEILLGNGSGYDLVTLAGNNGINISNVSGTLTMSATVGSSIETGDITNGEILAVDLNSDIPNTGEVLMYNSTTGGFAWEDITAAGGAGDIFAVGNVSSGSAFTSGGTGSELYFHNNVLTGLLNVASLTGSSKTYTLPNASGTLLVAGASGNLSAINMVGTIGTGVWQGDAIADAYIPNNITLAGASITLDTTTGTNEGQISWDDVNNRIVVGTGSGAVEFYANAGAGGLIGGSGNTNGNVAYWSGAGEISGEAQLSVSRGGTGIGTYSQGALLYGNNANTLNALNIGGNGRVLLSNGSIPVWGQIGLTTGVTGILPVANGGTGVDGSAVTDGQILIGNNGLDNFSLGTLSAGSGVAITNGAGSITIAANLANLITTGDIVDGTILPTDIDTNSQMGIVNGQVLTYNNGDFRWVTPGDGGTGGIGDIASVGDVESDAAFTELGLGSNLWFHVPNSTSITGLITVPTNGLTQSRTYTLPDKDGTLATTADVGNASHAEVTLAGSTNYLSLDTGTQVLTANAINLANTSNVSGFLGSAYGGTGVNASAASVGQLLIGNGSGLALGSISNATNGGITVTNLSSNIRLAIDLATTAVGTSTQSSVSGLETTSDGVRMLGGCADGQVLEWDTAGSVWQCSSKTGGTSDWTSGGSLTYLTDTNDDFAIGGSTVANSVFSVDSSTATTYFGSRIQSGVNPSLSFTAEDGDVGVIAFGTDDTFAINGASLRVGAGTANRAPLKIGVGTNLATTQQGAFEFDGLQLYFTPGSDGTTHRRIAYYDEVAAGSHNAVTLDTQSGVYNYLQLTDQAITVDAINLQNHVTGTLPVGNGGTGATTLSVNGVLVGNGTGSVMTKVPGSTGQILLSNASSVPTFASVSGDISMSSSGATAIVNDAVTLGTDTVGNYVASLTAGNGIGVSGATGETSSHILSLGALTTDWSQTGAGDIILNNSSSNLQILENGGGTQFGTFDVDVLSADRSYIFPDANGYVALRSSTVPTANQLALWESGSVLKGINSLGVAQGGTGLVSNPTQGQVLIGNASSGYILGTIAGGSGVTVNDAVEGLITITSSFGSSIDSIDITNGAIKGEDLLATTPGAPQDGYLLQYKNSNGGFDWVAPGDVGAATITAVGDVTTGNAFTSGGSGTKIWFYEGTGGYRGRLTTENTTLTASQYYNLPNASGTVLVAGALGNLSSINTVGTITTGTWQGNVIADAYIADALTITEGTITLKNSASPTPTTEGMIEWDSDDNTIIVGDGSGGQAIFYASGSGGTIANATAQQNRIAYWADNDGTLGGLTSIEATQGGTGQISYTVGDLLYADTATSLGKLADVATGSVLRSGGVGVAPSWGKVSLTSDVTGTLPLGNGGTNASLTALSGGIVYSNASSLAITSAGTAGRALISGGSGAPSWFAPTQGSLLFAGASGALASESTVGNLYWDATNKRLGLGTATPSAMLSLYGANNKLRLGYDGSNYVDFSTSATSTLTIQNASSTEPIIRLNNGTTQDASIQFDGASTDFYAGMDDTLSAYMIGTGFAVGNNVALTISNVGKIGIGTTTPGTKLAVNGLTATSSYNLVRVDTATGNFYYDASSARYKDDIKSFSEDFSKILEVDPKIYKDKASGLTEIGLIAEELDKLGLTHLVNYTEEGVVDGVKYERVPLYLLGVARDQQARIEANTKDIGNQKNTLSEIQSSIDSIYEENQAIMDFFMAINPDTLAVKDALGNLNLGEGKLEAAGVVAGVFTVRIADEEARTIGTVSTKGKDLDDPEVVTVSVTTEEDDRVEGYVYEVTVPTTAITDKSKVFITPRSPADIPMSVSKKDSGKGFGVRVKTSKKLDDEEKIIFDWVLVEEQTS